MSASERGEGGTLTGPRRSRKKCGLAPTAALLVLFLSQLAGARAPPPRGAPIGTHPVSWQKVSDPPPRGERPPGGARRLGLILAAVGDHSRHISWLASRPRNSWDLAVFYYGNDPGFSCPTCVAVVQAKGPKWRLIRDAFYSGLIDPVDVARRYRTIMIADDDLGMAGVDIAHAMQVHTAHGLAISQMSLCPGSYSWWDIVMQNSTTLLRYTNFCELMAPIIDTSVFVNVVLDTLADAHVGWGLDFLWPNLLSYPTDKLAIIDDICMVHKGRPPNATATLYSAPLPMTPKEELVQLLERYNVTRDPPSPGLRDPTEPVVYRAVLRDPWQPHVYGSMAHAMPHTDNSSAYAALGAALLLLAAALLARRRARARKPGP